MGNVLVYIFNALINSISGLYICGKISRNKNSYKDVRVWICFIIFTISLAIIFNLVNSYIKVAIITLVLILGLRYLLKYELKNAIVTALTFQIITFISEFLFSICLFMIFKNDTQIIVNNYIGSTLSTVILATIMILISHIRIFEKIHQGLLNITEKIKNSSLIIVLFVLIISVNLFLAMPYYQIDSIFIVIINAAMIFIYSTIVFSFIREKNRYIEISDKYSLTESSLKELQNNVNRLMTTNHENKNQLLTIRTMVANKDKNTLKNIDAIIEQKVKDDRFLKEKTSVIANTMLGALIYSKLLNMKDKSINCEFHIDKQITKLDFINIDDKTNVDICKIIGTYLDNTIDASFETEEKEAYINIYIEDNQLFIEISNSFNGIIDFERMNESGYTTKEQGHGYGLALAREIIKSNNKLESETEVNGNIFTQRLKIKM